MAQQNKALPRPGNRTRTNRTFVLPEYTYEDSEIHHSVGNSARVWGLSVTLLNLDLNWESSDASVIALGPQPQGIQGTREPFAGAWFL